MMAAEAVGARVCICQLLFNHSANCRDKCKSLSVSLSLPLSLSLSVSLSPPSPQASLSVSFSLPPSLPSLPLSLPPPSPLLPPFLSSEAKLVSEWGAQADSLPEELPGQSGPGRVQHCCFKNRTQKKPQLSPVASGALREGNRCRNSHTPCPSDSPSSAWLALALHLGSARFLIAHSLLRWGCFPNI